MSKIQKIACFIATYFTFQKDTFYELYSHYCQNHPRSESLREMVGESNAFFQSCQTKLGHKLPLAAYLLKPIQRITKYQLLLKVWLFVQGLLIYYLKNSPINSVNK